jgi:hypothetical protein
VWSSSLGIGRGDKYAGLDSTRYSRHILNKLEFSGDTSISEESLNIMS